MLKIKLARFGKKKQPHYRIVINEARDKRDGRYVALIGHYAPTQTPKILSIDAEAYKSWLTKGAQPTDTVAALFKQFESGKPFSVKKTQLSRKAKAKAAAAKEAQEAAAAAPAEVAPVVEAAPESTSTEVAATDTVAAEPETTPES